MGESDTFDQNRKARAARRLLKRLDPTGDAVRAFDDYDSSSGPGHQHDKGGRITRAIEQLDLEARLATSDGVSTPDKDAIDLLLLVVDQVHKQASDRELLGALGELSNDIEQLHENAIKIVERRGNSAINEFLIRTAVSACDFSGELSEIPHLDLRLPIEITQTYYAAGLRIASITSNALITQKLCISDEETADRTGVVDAFKSAAQRNNHLFLLSGGYGEACLVALDALSAAKTGPLSDDAALAGLAGAKRAVRERRAERSIDELDRDSFKVAVSYALDLLRARPLEWEALQGRKEKASAEHTGSFSSVLTADEKAILAKRAAGHLRALQLQYKADGTPEEMACCELRDRLNRIEASRGIRVPYVEMPDAALLEILNQRQFGVVRIAALIAVRFGLLGEVQIEEPMEPDNLKAVKRPYDRFKKADYLNKFIKETKLLSDE